MRPFSGSPNLEQLRNLARDLLKEFRAGDPQARRRVEAQLPRFAQSAHTPNPAGTRTFVLADALLVIAWRLLPLEREDRHGVRHDAPNQYPQQLPAHVVEAGALRRDVAQRHVQE